MSLFPIPKGVIEKIITLQRRFLWNGNSSKKAMSLVAWASSQFPSTLVRGLGIGNLHHKNIILLFKWIWRFLNESQSLWQASCSSQIWVKTIFHHPQHLSLSYVGGPCNRICSSSQSKDEDWRWFSYPLLEQFMGGGEATLKFYVPVSLD